MERLQKAKAFVDETVQEFHLQKEQEQQLPKRIQSLKWKTKKEPTGKVLASHLGCSVSQANRLKRTISTPAVRRPKLGKYRELDRALYAWVKAEFDGQITRITSVDAVQQVRASGARLGFFEDVTSDDCVRLWWTRFVKRFEKMSNFINVHGEAAMFERAGQTEI
jgi:hypothetical protein